MLGGLLRVPADYFLLFLSPVEASLQRNIRSEEQHEGITGFNNQVCHQISAEITPNFPSNFYPFPSHAQTHTPPPPPPHSKGCFCHPSFGYASDKKARRCARHRLENMEGVKGHKQKRRKESTASISAATSASTATATPSSTTTIGAPRPSTPAVSPTHTATIPPFSSFNSRNARGSVESAVRKESMGAGRDRGGVGGSRGEGGTPVGVGGSTRRVGVSGPGGMAARSAVARV